MKQEALPFRAGRFTLSERIDYGIFMSAVDKLTKDTLSKGGVLAILYFDLHGSSKDMLQDLGSGFVQKLLKEPGVVYAVGEIDEPMPAPEGKGVFFSTSVQVKLLTTDFNSLLNLCATYSPFSLEILEPDEIKLSIDKAHDVLINVATLTFDYKKYIIQKIAGKEDLERYKTSLAQKIDLGKRLTEKKGEK